MGLPWTTRFRQERMRRFEAVFRPTEQTTVIDVGGTPLNWTLVASAPRVTLFNVLPPDEAETLPPNIGRVTGDGRSLPFDDEAFDVSFSNSTIEHVGSLADQERFASEIRRVGRGVYLQTPARSFPLEPHWYGLFIHWLPRRVQKRIARWVTLYGLVRKPSPELVADLVDEYRLLSHHEMRRLFPDCEIHRERVAGLTKSYVAIRRPG